MIPRFPPDLLPSPLLLNQMRHTFRQKKTIVFCRFLSVLLRIISIFYVHSLFHPLECWKTQKASKKVVDKPFYEALETSMNLPGQSLCKAENEAYRNYSGQSTSDVFNRSYSERLSSCQNTSRIFHKKNKLMWAIFSKTVLKKVSFSKWTGSLYWL